MMQQPLLGIGLCSRCRQHCLSCTTQPNWLSPWLSEKEVFPWFTVLHFWSNSKVSALKRLPLSTGVFWHPKKTCSRVQAEQTWLQSNAERQTLDWVLFWARTMAQSLEIGATTERSLLVECLFCLQLQFFLAIACLMQMPEPVSSKILWSLRSLLNLLYWLLLAFSCRTGIIFKADRESNVEPGLHWVGEQEEKAEKAILIPSRWNIYHRIHSLADHFESAISLGFLDIYPQGKTDLRLRPHPSRPARALDPPLMGMRLQSNQWAHLPYLQWRNAWREISHTTACI